MKRQVSWALLAAGTAVAAAVTTAAPAAATSGSQTVNGTIVASGVSGTRTVITSVVIFKGAFNGVGKIVEVDNLPGDPDNVNRDDLVFATGSMHIVNTIEDFAFSANPRSCVFTATVTGRGVLPRGSDGSCDPSRDPLHEVDMITATGTLSF